MHKNQILTIVTVYRAEFEYITKIVIIFSVPQNLHVVFWNCFTEDHAIDVFVAQ